MKLKFRLRASLAFIMSFKTEYKKHQHAVHGALDAFFKKEIKQSAKQGNDITHYMSVLADYTLNKRAKRIRGVLTRLGYSLYNGTRTRAIMDIVVAIELAHSWLLIHDDIIDRDTMRRGTPTAHKTFEKFYKKRFGHDAEHKGISMAIILGDTVATYAYDIIAGSSFPGNRILDVLRIFNNNLKRTSIGEFKDILSEDDEGSIVSVYTQKTALYTFVNPLVIGAGLAGAPTRQLALLERIGINVGIAYQLHDDIIGMFGSCKSTGKIVGGDIYEKKNTLLIHEARKLGTPSQRRVLNGVWKKTTVCASDVKKIREIVLETGALDKTRNRAKELIQKAKTSLDKLDNVRAKDIDFLKDLADYCITRHT